MSKKQQKKIINVTVDTVSPHEFDTTLGKLKSYIDSLIDEYGADAQMDWNSNHWEPYDSSASPRFEVRISREENDAEYKKRVADETAISAAGDERDRKEFERLQSKFGAKK